MIDDAGGLSIEEILEGAEPPEDFVRLCLKGSLRRRYEALEADHRTASTVAASLGELAPAKIIETEMLDLLEQMKRWTKTFVLRAIDPADWRRFLNTMPDVPTTDEERASHDARYHAWVCQLIALTCHSPAMSSEQAAQLAPKLSSGQWAELTNKSYAVNAERQDVPFSVAASEMIGSTAQNLRRRALGESPTPAGSAKNPAEPRRTSTTKRAA